MASDCFDFSLISLFRIRVNSREFASYNVASFRLSARSLKLATVFYREFTRIYVKYKAAIPKVTNLRMF